jgi:cytochrome P450
VEDTTIGGYDIPAGSDVVLSVWSIHRRADLWPEPDRFNPDRFLGNPDIGRYDWLPFGAGPRACIGQHFSMLESLATIAELVRDFEFTAPAGSSDHVPVGSGITLFPLEPVLSEVVPRP